METISVNPFVKEETRSPEWVSGYKKGFHDGRKFQLEGQPDLLKAPEKILAWADNQGCSEAFQREARAAIAKAKGRAV